MIQYTYGTGMDSDARMTAEDQIKQQTWLGGTSFEGTLITPGIVSPLLHASTPL